MSLLPVVNYLKDKLLTRFVWLKIPDGVDVAEGELVVMENVRFNKGGERRRNPVQKIRWLCDVS
ncbi:hypothetical protein ACLK1T_18095 [Escherichia coli]